MGTQKSQEVEWEPPGSWVLTLVDLLILLNQGQRKNVPLFSKPQPLQTLKLGKRLQGQSQSHLHSLCEI
jgi:hypothetical protein